MSDDYRAAVMRVLLLHRRVNVVTYGGYPPGTFVTKAECDHCREGEFLDRKEWPCPTVQALRDPNADPESFDEYMQAAMPEGRE